ncbi:putative nuclease HARBI1 [Heterodontus francisci]|uniref:putative nuclease HARBI1 n=1 Tax=Heterodontus francisci TaxID=7792 RepID=UPI00355AF48F
MDAGMSAHPQDKGKLLSNVREAMKMSCEMASEIWEIISMTCNHKILGSIGDMCGISEAALHRCIKEVTNALFHHANDFVYFPIDKDSPATRSEAFGAIAHFPRLQGVIECTHVVIRAAWDQTAAFVNRKGVHSLSIQLVCDHSTSQLGGRILGDKGYPHLTWLMRPVRHLQNTAEKRYNAAHTFTRAIIEHTIGLLKICFRYLDQSGGAFQYASQRVSQIIIVCCALHNLAMQRRHILHAEEREEQQSFSDEDE